MIVPSFADQFFWGWRVHELGAGPKPIPRKKLTTARLTEAIQQSVHDENIRRQAAVIGEQIRAENGVEVAVHLIEDLVKHGHR